MSVIGCGLVGSASPKYVSAPTLDLLVREVDNAAAAAGQFRIANSLDRAVKAGRLSGFDEHLVRPEHIA